MSPASGGLCHGLPTFATRSTPIAGFRCLHMSGTNLRIWNGCVVRKRIDGGCVDFVIGLDWDENEQTHDNETGQRARHFADARVVRLNLLLQNLEECDEDEGAGSERLQHAVDNSHRCRRLAHLRHHHSYTHRPSVSTMHRLTAPIIGWPRKLANIE